MGAAPEVFDSAPVPEELLPPPDPPEPPEATGAGVCDAGGDAVGLAEAVGVGDGVGLAVGVGVGAGAGWAITVVTADAVTEAGPRLPTVSV